MGSEGVPADDRRHDLRGQHGAAERSPSSQSSATAGVPRAGLGISATVAVNVTAGLAFGVVGAIVAAWPAPALVISYELLMVVIRSAGPGPAAPDGYATPEREHDVPPVRPTQPAAVSAGPERRALPGSPGTRTIRHGKTAARRMPAADREAAVLAAVAAEPDITHAELARRMGVDEATIRRVRKRLTPVAEHAGAGASNGKAPPG
jgi:transposase-like protein